MAAEKQRQSVQTIAKVIPLFGRDEMNLIEYPFGPITPLKNNTMEIEHIVTDRKTKKLTKRTLLITGSEAFGLPRPTDEHVLLGLKALTCEAGFVDRKVFFSQYRLCKTIGWNPDGRAYRRLEHALDRIAGTTLKFKDSWWDKGEEEWLSKTFHLIDNVELCSAGLYVKSRQKSGKRDQALCSIVWNDVVWKSFCDGFIRKIDMEMFRRIASGRRREVPVRLYRWLDKQFYHRNVVNVDIKKLSLGTLGIAAEYPSEFKRIVDRAAKVLIDAKFVTDYEFTNGVGECGMDVSFWKEKHKRKSRPAIRSVQQLSSGPYVQNENGLREWISKQDEEWLQSLENEALKTNFGNKFERECVEQERQQGIPIKSSRPVRKQFLQKFAEQSSNHEIKRLVQQR